jgi:hypothetical protein
MNQLQLMICVQSIYRSDEITWGEITIASLTTCVM